MNLVKATDRDLIRQYLGGSEAAFEVLLKRHQTKGFSYILYTVKDEDIANDIFQDTFIKVVRTLKRGKYNEEGKFLPWVSRIAHNLIIDHFRRLKKMPTTSGGDDFDIFEIIPSDEQNASDSIEKAQSMSDVKALIKHLPDDQKEVLMMRMYFDMSFKEIAEKTGVSINTALGRMRYALINLRKLIKENNIILTN